MSIKNEDVMTIITNKFKSMEDHLNVMEHELSKGEDEEFNKTRTALSLGKISKLYEDITFLMGVYDGKPKYEGR